MQTLARRATVFSPAMAMTAFISTSSMTMVGMMPVTQLKNCCPPKVKRFINPAAKLTIKSIEIHLSAISTVFVAVHPILDARQIEERDKVLFGSFSFKKKNQVLPARVLPIRWKGEGGWGISSPEMNLL